MAAGSNWNNRPGRNRTNARTSAATLAATAQRLPVVRADVEVEVNEPVQQRRDQPVGPGPVLLAVRRRDHGPPGRQFVLAEFAIEHELQARGLDQGRGLGQLVEEQHALARPGQERGRAPDGGVLGHPGQAAEVDRVEQGRPQVDDGQVQVTGGLADDGRLLPTPGGPQT